MANELVISDFMSLRLLTEPNGIYVREYVDAVWDAYREAASQLEIPTSLHIHEEDPVVGVELYTKVLNIVVLGEYVEYPNEEEQAEVEAEYDNYYDDYRSDIQSIILSGRLFFMDGNEEIVNLPIVTIW